MLDPTPVRRRKRLWAFAIGLGTLLLAMALATRGLGDAPPIAGVLGFLYALISGGLLAATYLLAGVGLGAMVVRPFCRNSEHRPWLALALGPGLLLFISHGLGVLGLLSGSRGQWVAIAVLAIGMALFFASLLTAAKARPNLPHPPVAGLLWILPAAVTLVAACNPPGWLWGSEAAGFDALSYHLQLPQEWAAGERLWPLKHNVYSFLPSYVEAGFMHLAAALGAGNAAARPGASVGLLGFDGAGAIACQLLHAGFGLIAALLTARVVYSLLKQAGLPDKWPAEIAAIAGAVLLSVPWVIVVSSMAYTESAVNAMLAAGVLVAIDSQLTPWRRGTLAGLLVGLACGCKPTAAFMVAPLVGLLLLSRMDLRRWPVACAAGAFAAIVTVAPFLVRNWLASGNPVFPAATAWFGAAHWTPEQAARFASAHFEPAGFVHRLGLLFAHSGNGLSITGAGPPNEPRGIFHSQWAAFFPVALFAVGIAITWRPLRREVVLLLLGMAAGLAWWLLFSHCQSRFLLPLAPPIAILVGVAAGRLASWWLEGKQPALQRIGILLAAAMPLLMAGAAVRLFLSQQPAFPGGPGFPNLSLSDGSTRRTGDFVRGDLRLLSEEERAALLRAIGPEAFVNNFVTDAKVALVGGSTPFFFRGSATGRVVYHTTWDSSPIGAAIRALPAQPELWSEQLRARGIEYVLVDFSEVDRLSRDHWGDADVTLQAVAQWILSSTDIVREWPADRAPGAIPLQGLYRLRPVGGSRGKGSSS